MKILGNPKRRLTKRQMQKAIDREIEALEDELRAKNIKFSVPADNRKGKLYQQGDDK